MPINPKIVKNDVDLILWSFRLQLIHRYSHQRFWERETIELEHCQRISGKVFVENVAAHSWHVCDTAMLLQPHFPHLQMEKLLRLGILHDKLEIITGDDSPQGKDGKGQNTYAYNQEKRFQRMRKEGDALSDYINKLPSHCQKGQKEDLLELHDLSSEEALFIKAIDKLQVLAFLYHRKDGQFVDSHLKFTLSYTSKCIEYFEGLEFHFKEIRMRLLKQVAKSRGISLDAMEKWREQHCKAQLGFKFS